MRRTLIAVVFSPTLLASSAALADCRDDVAALRPKVDKVSDVHERQLLEFDLKRARQELGEGDEDECREAVDHANRLLRGEE